jgi:hypothetical protein
MPDAAAFPRPDPARSWPAALAIALLIVAIRSLWLSRLGLHLDEDISTLAARGIAATGLPELPSGHFYWRAPLFHYLLAPFAAPGIDWLPRVLTVALSAVTGVLVARGGAALIGGRAALLAGLIFAVSLVEIALARQIRMYSLFQPLALGAILLVHRFWTTGALRWGWASFALTLAALLAHELAVTLAVLYLPVAFRHARGRVWAFALGALGLMLAAQRAHRTFMDRTFCGGAARGAETAPPQGMDDAPLRAMLTADPLALARHTLGEPGMWIALALLAAAGVAIAWRGAARGDRMTRLAALGMVAAALGAAAAGLAGVALGVLLLVFLHRDELFPGAGGRRAVAIASAVAGAAVLGWIAITLARGLAAEDVILGMARWPGRLARLLLWPPAIAIAALAGAWAALRARGALPGGARFLVIAVAWLVIGRGTVGDRTQIRFLADLWPLWEMLAALGVTTLVAAARSRAGARAAFGAAAAMVVAALLLPGTSPRDVAGFLARTPGSRLLAAERLDTPAADLRGAAAWLAPRLDPGDAVVATDWLTTYTYTGRVDGWLRGQAYGWQSTPVDGVLRDCYLGARVLPDLGALLAFAEGRVVWIIAGSEELGGYEGLLAPDVRAWLLARAPAFTAADGGTRVYRIGPLAR